MGELKERHPPLCPQSVASSWAQLVFLFVIRCLAQIVEVRDEFEVLFVQCCGVFEVEVFG